MNVVGRYEDTDETTRKPHYTANRKSEERRRKADSARC